MDFLILNKRKATNFIYQQVYEGIREKILDGKLKAQEKLPSKRMLADDLGVSVNTITNAYEQLLAEGYIYTLERKGYYVENIAAFEETGTKRKLAEDLKEAPPDKEGWLSLSHMTTDISMFPFKEWLKCQDMAIKNHQDELMKLVSPQGPYIVRKTISRMIALTRGVESEPEQVVIGAGTQSLISQLMTMQHRDSTIAVENPGYSRFYTLLKNMGFPVKPIMLDEKGIDINAVDEANADFLFVTPSHQFPTGKIMPVSRRIELLNWAAEHDQRFIVEDDYDSEFKYETDSIPSLQSLDRSNCVIYTGTFSKTLLPGLRISYMVLPPQLLRKYRDYAADWMQYSNSLSLFTLHYFIESGGYARHVKRMNLQYEGKRKDLINQLKERFNQNVVIEDIPAGLHFLAKFKTSRTYTEIEDRAKQHKLEVYSIRRFLLNEEYKSGDGIYLIIGFADLKIDDINEAVDRLYGVVM